MATLRSPEGCPWDKQQTHQSLLPYLVEESHEYIDAAQANDKAHMAEELGDVLFQVVFHSQVAKENGDFSIDDVVQGICEKMIRRHPHVFGDAKVDDSKGVVRQWERIKAQEKNNLKMQGKSAMDKVSKSLPTLARAQELQRRAAKVSFDWTEAEPVFNKAVEEFSEFRAEMQAASPENRNVERMEDEFGDIMFSLVNECGAPLRLQCGPCAGTCEFQVRTPLPRRRTDGPRSGQGNEGRWPRRPATNVETGEGCIQVVLIWSIPYWNTKVEKLFSHSISRWYIK